MLCFEKLAMLTILIKGKKAISVISKRAKIPLIQAILKLVS